MAHRVAQVVRQAGASSPLAVAVTESADVRQVQLGYSGVAVQ